VGKRNGADILFRNSNKTGHGIAWETGLLEAHVEVFHEQAFWGVDC
jgi:hypothetical protein